MHPGQPGRFLDKLRHNCLRGPIPNTPEIYVNATQKSKLADFAWPSKNDAGQKMFFTPAILK
jgi:hypothetical protein